MLIQFDKAWFHISHEKQSSKMGLKHFLRKKKKNNSEHPIIEAQRERPKLLNNSRKNLFNIKITVLLDLAWSKMGGSNLLHSPTSTLSFRGRNHSCIFSKFTYSHNFKKAISQDQLALER